MTRRYRTGILLVILALLGYLAYLVLRPFLGALAGAGVFAVIAYPVHNLLLRRGLAPSLAAAATTLLVLFLIIGPLSYLGYLLVNELNKVSLSAVTPEHVTQSYHQSFLEPMINRVLGILGIDQARSYEYLQNGLRSASKAVLTYMSHQVGNVASAIFNFFVMVVVLFFFLRDGRLYAWKLLRFLPFSIGTKQRLAQQVKDVIVSTIYAGLVVAVCQGVVATIAYLSLAIASPLLWGSMTTAASFVPFFGSALVWVPISVYLLLHGQILKCIVLVAVSVFGVGLVDNIVRPLVVKGRARMSFLLTFLSVLGGVQVFGLLGIVLGPLVMVLFTSVIYIVRDTEEPRTEIQT